MPRIRRSEDRAAERRQYAELHASEALGQSEAGPSRTVGLIVWDDGKVPRVPFIGAHAGAIEGSIPHRQRRIDGYRGRSR